MTPIQHFESVWKRCDELRTLHIYLSSKVTNALSTDELLRSEWVARISALDLFIHEKVAQGMVKIFEGQKPKTPAFLRHQISNETLTRIHNSNSLIDSASAFDLEIRQKLGFISYQDPEKIADGIRLISEKPLWNEIAIYQGADENNKSQKSKNLKRKLSLIVTRRNQIAHEGDLQQDSTREPWPIDRVDVNEMSEFIENIVNAIDAIIT